AVRASVMVKAIVAGQHAAAIGGQQHALGLARVDEYVVHDHVRRRIELPFAAAVKGLPQAARGAGIHGAGPLRVLLQNPGTDRRVRYAVDAGKKSAGIQAFVNSRTGAEENRGGPAGIDRSEENVGIQEHSLLDAVPALAAIFGFPWQVEGAGIDN